ncbi:AAA family ATPase [Shinella kummerowiae]|uniref:AAA family ATPase n=1 Tax=Shinella kummerowiae TaxID=417745 RepID=A0A6N8SFY9_9HYPH|nr:ATP/GTP-binding protein [Shinella kummerowiae]MXN46216.1 AAA family ATPase [Shinella kummerowiae]
MLLRFSVKNFLSFKDEASLSMVASHDERHADHILAERQYNPKKILRSAAIYGANGHGKTNLFNAIKFVKEFIVEGNEEGPIPVRSYKSNSSPPEATEFIFNFSTGGVDYEYGLKLSSTSVEEEWLFHSPKGRDVRVFERVTKRKKNGDFETLVELGTPLKRKVRGDRASGAEFMEFLSIGISPTQPYLTEAVKRNVKWLRAPFNWFRRSLQVISADSDYGALNVRAHEDADFIKALSDRIKETGIGIDHIETAARKFDLSDLKGIPFDIGDFIENTVGEGDVVEFAGPDGKKVILKKKEGGEVEVIDLLAVYRRDDGGFVKFSQEEESSGTRRLFNLLPMLVDLGNSDRTFVIDELDRKLHPLLSYELLKSFLNSSECGQIIFTTHNTHLLDLDLFRRDEIWFVEKDRNGQSTVYSLADLNVRPDVDVRRGYLNGRFGAIPFVGNIFDLGWADSNQHVANNTKTKATGSRKKTSARRAIDNRSY